MTDSTGSAGGVSGSGGANGGGAASDAASAAAAQGSAAERAADAMVDAATGPTGVNVDALGQTAAGLAAADPKAAAEVQAAIEAQLTPVQAGQLQSAIAQATASGQVASPFDLATKATLPEVDIVRGPFDAQGQLVDPCGNVVTSLSASRPDPLAESYKQAVENLGRAVGGPISGPAYTAAWASGMSQPRLDDFHSVVQHADGLFERYASQAETMHVPISNARP